uniref:Uncharacterized protein n=1 Tax=Nothoprocta perdicaria TaxID=30464 RepID=A0A8C6ZJV3_NOTPE
MVCGTEPCPGTLCGRGRAPAAARAGGGRAQRGAPGCSGSCRPAGHCSWGGWTAWSACSRSCNVGMRRRYRDASGGRDCPGPRVQLDFCIVHGRWSPWTPWSECSASCGPGLQRRYRFCTAAPCAEPGPQPDERPCVLEPCSRECRGLHRAARGCTGTASPPGHARAGHGCMHHPPCVQCPAMGTRIGFLACTSLLQEHASSPMHAHHLPCMLILAMGSCIISRACMALLQTWPSCGHMHRLPCLLRNEVGGCRNGAGVTRPTRRGAEGPCPRAGPGGWGAWSAWSGCSRSCGQGVRSRSRACSSPPPQGQGDFCEGAPLQVEACNAHGCPGERARRGGAAPGAGARR